MNGQLHHGNNLAVLADLPDGSVDLVYMDPPFFTQQRWTAKAGGFDDRWHDLWHYLAHIARRVAEIRRVLKPTGSLYLHCDDHAANEIAVYALDPIFGPGRLLNRIAWKRTAGAHSKTGKALARVHDTIWLYGDPDLATFHPQVDEHGEPLGDVWLGPHLNAASNERVGWPTQKPVALLERIIAASSNPGDLVLDPYAGCGTTLVAAERLGRRWIGIEAQADAIDLTLQRLDALAPSAPTLFNLEGAA